LHLGHGFQINLAVNAGLRYTITNYFYSYCGGGAYRTEQGRHCKQQQGNKRKKDASEMFVPLHASYK
jgi:hypothetical protein